MSLRTENPWDWSILVAQRSKTFELSNVTQEGQQRWRVLTNKDAKSLWNVLRIFFGDSIGTKFHKQTGRKIDGPGQVSTDGASNKIRSYIQVASWPCRFHDKDFHVCLGACKTNQGETMFKLETIPKFDYSCCIFLPSGNGAKKWKREGIVLVTCAIMSNVTLAVGPSVSCCRVAPSFFPSLSSFPCPQRVRSFHDNGKIWENVRDWKNNKAETI